MANDSNRDCNRDKNGADSEIVQGLRKSLEDRKVANPAGSLSAAATSSALEQQLQQTWKALKVLMPSTPNVNRTGCGRGAFQAARRSCPGLSPTSSDSSVGYSLSISPKNKGKGLTTATSVSSVPHGASARLPFFMGSCSNGNAARENLLGVSEQEGGVKLIRNSLVPSTTAGRGRNALSTNEVIGKAPKPKRKRPSKKPHTEIIECSKEDFPSTVQRITGCPLPTAQLVRPQPDRPPTERQQLERAQHVRKQSERPESPQSERPQVKAAPISVDMVANPPARPGSSSTSGIHAVPSPSPTVSNRVPEARYSFDSSESTSSDSLNMTFGYGYTGFLFKVPDLAGTDDLTLASGDGHSPKPEQYTSHEVEASASTASAEASLKGASVLDRNGDIQPSTGSALVLPESSSSEYLGLERNRRSDTSEDFEMADLDFESLFPWSLIGGFER